MPVNFSGIIFGILAMIPIYLFAVGIGFIFSLIAGVMRDIAIILPLVLNVLMMLSPVMYPIDRQSFLGRMNVWNPFNYLVNSVRDLIFYGRAVPWGYWISVILVLLVFLASWRFFQLAQARIAERI